MIAYVVLRLYISVYENFFRWTGKKKNLRKALRESKNYKEWVENAMKLDEYLKLDGWKQREHFYYYDYDTLKLTIKKMNKLKKEKNNESLMLLLQSCVKANFAGTENPLLYSQTYYGTKTVVEEYNTRVSEALQKIIDDESIPQGTKKVFFKSLNKNFGKSALCLSGGATFAYNHFGVIKALLENDLLPNIISGTSGGGIVAALAATRTNEELKELIKPELANRITACSEGMLTYIPRWWKTGARFDAEDWARKAMWFTMGSMTFKEAYERTGKILNISTVPADPHSPVILCNHITAPNCVIWSALLASSAVPGILNPVVLMMKDPNSGDLVPFSLGTKYKDGSLRTDIPVEALNMYYNVKFSIVSQVNPHISLFYFAPKGSVGRPVSRAKIGLRGGFIGAGLESFIKLENRKWLQLIKGLDLLPHFMNQDWSNLWLQRFSGTITIWPKLNPFDLRYILTDPTEERLEHMIRNGEMSTFPKLLFIKHRLNIEHKIREGWQKFKRSARKTDQELLSDSGDERQQQYYHTDSNGLQFQVKFDEKNDDEDIDIDEEQVAYDPFKLGKHEEERSLRRRVSLWL
jgi:predicted acylesterase/phospholipase RssA